MTVNAETAAALRELANWLDAHRMRKWEKYDCSSTGSRARSSSGPCGRSDAASRRTTTDGRA